jgi:hypothetical protein
VKYIPAYFPGAGFRKEASKTRESLRDFVDIPFQYTMDEKVYLPSLIILGH